MPAQSQDIEQWDRYWRYGNIHSFSQVSGGNYQGAIAAFWKSRFSNLEQGGCVLDIATGNGAIALLALAESQRLGTRCRICGVDLAAIDPVNQVKDPALASALMRIEFRGRVSAESLPFDNESVDMACSQFGIEYSDLSRSIPEVARVLKPAGRFAAIMHHRDSVLLDSTREELDQLGFVLDEVKLYLRTRNLLRAMAGSALRGSAGGIQLHSKARKKHQAVQDALARIQQAANAATNSKMLLGPARYIHEILSALGRAEPGELLGWLEEARRRVEANRRRLLDMRGAATDPEDRERLERLLAASGFSDVRVEPFVGGAGELLGWQVDASRLQPSRA